MSISIITAQRGREDRINDFIEHYSSFYPDSDIIIGYQSDTSKFKKGQLFNLLFDYSIFPYVAFIDIDIRVIEKIDLINEMKILNNPFLPYNKIERRIFQGDSIYSSIPNLTLWEKTPGGFLFFTKEQYLKVNGHSNLYIGYGYEDADMKERANLSRINRTIIHLEHELTDEGKDINSINKNINIWKRRGSRDINKDGRRQTVGTINNIEYNNNNVRKIFISNIGVCDDFIYKGLLI